MNKVAGACAAGLMLAISGTNTALAETPPARVPVPVAAHQQDLAAVQTWLAEVAAWGQGYDAVVAQRTETMGWMIDQAGELMDKLDTAGASAGRVWARNFATEARRRLAAEMAAFQALPAEVPPFPASLPVGSTEQARLEAMQEAPERAGALLVTTGQSAETYIALVEAAASGDEEALIRLGKGVYTLLAAHMEAENVMMEALKGPPGEANYYWRTAMITSNQAMIAWMRHNQAVVLETTSDAPGAARDIRRHADETKAAADSMTAAVRRTESRMAASPEARSGEGAELMALFTALFASLRESATVESRLGAELDRLADAVLAGDETAEQEVMGRIDTLINRRIELDATRRQLMAQGGVS